MTSEQVAREVGEKRATLVGVQTELTRLTEEIRAISPEKANEFEKAAIDLLLSEQYKNPRAAADALLDQITNATYPARAYEERRENLVALLTRVAAFVGEMKKMAEAAIQKARDEIIEANRKRLADEAATATRLAAEAERTRLATVAAETEAQRIATEARETAEKANAAREAAETETKRLAAIATEAENNRLAALAAARAVVSDAITPPAQRDVPPLTDTPTSRDGGPTNRSATPRPPDASASDSVSRGDGPTEQANADMKLKPPAEPRRDAEPQRTTPEVQTSPTVVIAPKDMLTALANGAPDSVRTLVSEALGRCSEKVQFTLTPELVKSILSQETVMRLLTTELAKNKIKGLDISKLKWEKNKQNEGLTLSEVKAQFIDGKTTLNLNLSAEIVFKDGLPVIRAIKHTGGLPGVAVNAALQAIINAKNILPMVNGGFTQEGIRSALESQGISGDRVSLALDSSGNPVISLHKAQKPPPSTGVPPAPRTSPSSPPPSPVQPAPRQNDSDAQPHVSEQGPDRRTTQANAGIAFTRPDGTRQEEQGPDGQGLEENDNRKAAETAAAVEKAREKEQILTLINEQMTVLKGLQVELDKFHATIRLLSKIVDNDFGDAVYKLLKENNYSYYEQDGNGNMVVQKLLTQIQSAADPVTEYATHKDRIESYVEKVASLTIKVKQMAEDFLKKAQVEKEREDVILKAGAEAKLRTEAAELARIKAEVGLWLKSIDDSIDRYQREYTAIDDDMKANFPQIYEEFTNRVRELGKKPEFNAKTSSTLDLLESARRDIRESPNHLLFLRYSAKKDIVADCLGKDEKHLAAIKELAEEMKKEATNKAQAEAELKVVEEQRRQAAELVRAAEQPAENRAVVPYVKPDRRVATARSEKRPEEKMPQYGYAEMDEMAKKIVLPVPPTGEPPRSKERGDNSAPLQLAAPKDKEQIDKEQKGKDGRPVVSADAKVDGAARVVTNEASAQTREERWKKAIPSGSYTLESVPDSLHTLTIAGAQYEVFAVLSDDITLPDGLNDPAAKKKEFMRQLNAASESTVIFFCKNKTTNEPQIVLYQHQRAGSVKALRELTTLQESEGSRLALEEKGISVETWADFIRSPATHTFVLEQLKKNNLAIGPDLKGAYRADIVYDAGGPQLSFGQPLAAAGESPSQASLWEEDKKNASLGTAMVMEWVGAENFGKEEVDFSGIPVNAQQDTAYAESIKKLISLGIVDAKAHPYGVVDGVGKLIDFAASVPLTEEALVAYMDYVGAYYGIAPHIIEASKLNRAEVLKSFIVVAESRKKVSGQYATKRSECIDQVVAQARVSLPAIEAQCAQEKSAHTAHVEAQAQLAREQKLCARFVDEWKKYVDEQISALEVLIPQAKDTMSEENLNKFRKIVREYNTALDIIDEERGKKGMVPGWEALTAVFPSDGASPAAARFTELQTQFEQLHLQESLDYTYAVTRFKETFVNGVPDYLLELRIFSAALGKISLDGVASRLALEQSRDQVITEKLRKVIEVSGYGKETGDKLATYADLYKSLSTPNSGVSPALVELQLPVITDALGKTYQTLIAETAEHAIAPTGYKTISEAIDRLREFKESVASKRLYVLRNIDDFRRIPGALTTIAKAVSPITDPALREVIAQGNKTSDYESLAQAAELYAGIRSALDKGPNTDRTAANAAEARGAEARVDTRGPESAPQAAQVEGFVPYQGSTRTLAEAVRTKRENDRSPRVAYLEYYQKHPEKIVSFEGTVYLLGRTIDAGANGRVFEAFVATEEQQQALHIQMGERYNPTTIDKVWIQKNTPQVVSGADGVQRIAGQEIVDDLTTPEFGTLQPTHLALKFKRDTMMVIPGGIGTGEAVSFQRELDVYRRFSANEELKAHSPQLHGNFHTSFPEGALAMTWVDGELSMSGPVSDDEILRVADELLALIDASEQVGCPLGHDNVKSGSVMMCPDGQVRLIDLDNDGIEGRNKNLALTLQLLALQSLASKGNISYGMSELLSRISGLEDLRNADARRAQIVELTKAIAEYRALRSQDIPTLTAQMNDATVPAQRRLAAFDVLSEKMKGKVSHELATAASQLYFDQSVNTALSWTERELSRSLGSTRFPADMRYLILPLIPLKDTQAVQNTKDRNLDKLAEQFPANHELQAMTAALRLLSKAITHTDYRERERERKGDAYGLANICQDIPGISLDGADKWLIKLIPYSMAKGRNYEVYTARDIIGAYKRDPVYRYGLADLTGHMLPAKRIEIIQEQDANTTHIDLKDIKDGGSIVDVITYPGYSPDRPELTISNGWVSTRLVDANMTLEPSVPWSSIDNLVGKDSRITLKGGQGRHVDRWIDGAIRIVAPPEQVVSPTQLFVRIVRIDGQSNPVPVQLHIEDTAAKVLIGVGSEDIACDHKDQLYILDKSAFGEQYKINIPADYKEDSITFPAQSAEGNKNAHVVFVRRKIGTREEWLFSHFVDENSKSDGNGDVNREKKTEQLGTKTVDEANGLLESWTNFTQKQNAENPTLSFDTDRRQLGLAIVNFLNARNTGEKPAIVLGLLEALKAQIPISQRNLEAAKADPVAYANTEAALMANRLNSLQ